MRILRSLILTAAAAFVLSACATTIATVTDPPGASTNARLAFAPLSGPPGPVADNLARSFASASVARGLTLAPYRSRRSAYVIKGFISVLPGKNGTTAVYVWDVLSPDLQRLHRISGQATDPAKANDPWAALSQQTLDIIADTTLDRLALWLASR